MKIPFSQDQINGILRIIVPGICTWLAAKGFNWLGDEGIQAELVAIVVGIAAVVWSYFSHTPAAAMKAVKRIDPGIEITVPNHVVEKHPSIKDLIAQFPESFPPPPASPPTSPT